MIELGHVATGAVVGTWSDGLLGAALLGVASHALFDATPHGEVHHELFEVVSSLTAFSLLLLRYGARDRRLWGAFWAVAPDFEHLVPGRERRRALFPTHRFETLHRSDVPLSIPAWAQVVLGGAIVGGLLARRTGAAAAA